jgi:hypothetical protein
MTTFEEKRGVLSGGRGLVFRNWRCLTWTYLFNLVLASIAAIPLRAQTGALLDHSLAARNIAGKLDLAQMGAAISIINERPTGLVNSSLVLDLGFAAILFLFTPAILSIFLSDELASLGNLFRVGLRFFWRMVRLGLVFLIVGGIPLGILAAIRGALLNRLDNIYVEREFFLWSLAMGLIVLFVAILVRLWFDLAQLVIVDRGTYRIGRVESRSAWKALGPAWRLLRAGFWRLFFSFVLIDLLGLAALLLALFVWRAAPAGSVWLAFVIEQIGLFLLLAARFWQRGMEVAWFSSNTAVVAVPVTPLVEPVVPPFVDTPPFAEPV